MKDQKQTVVEHLQELRMRIIYSIIAIVIGISIGWSFSGHIYDWVMAPAGKTYATGVTEVFMTQFRLGAYAGLALVFPFILWQVVAYILPALESNEKRLLWWLPFGIVLFVAGVSFAYYVVMPVSYRFFIQIAEGRENVDLIIKTSDYLSFVTGLIIPFGIVFELPLVVAILARIGLITARGLSKFRKYAILIIFVLAAVVSPTPDPISQTIFAAPMVLLYELSIILARVVGKKRAA